MFWDFWGDGCPKSPPPFLGVGRFFGPWGLMGSMHSPPETPFGIVLGCVHAIGTPWSGGGLEMGGINAWRWSPKEDNDLGYVCIGGRTQKTGVTGNCWPFPCISEQYQLPVWHATGRRIMNLLCCLDHRQKGAVCRGPMSECHDKANVQKRLLWGKG